MEHVQLLPILAVNVRPSSELDDHALVHEICSNGSPDCFEVLVERYKHRVFRLMTSVLGPALARDAEDATQEVFLHVHRKLSQFRSESRFSTWLYRVAYHKAIDHRRKLMRGLSEPLPDAGLEQPDRRPEADPMRRSLSTERRRTVTAAMAAVPEPARTVLHLRYWLDASVREIADVLDMNEGTVKSHLFRGRQRLARELNPEGQS